MDNALQQWRLPALLTTRVWPAIVKPILAAFQNVEDELASLRVLGQQNGVQQAAVQAAQRAVEITLNEYQAGPLPIR